jgi:hypothetical protein
VVGLYDRWRRYSAFVEIGSMTWSSICGICVFFFGGATDGYDTMVGIACDLANWLVLHFSFFWFWGTLKDGHRDFLVISSV